MKNQFFSIDFIAKIPVNAFSFNIRTVVKNFSN